MSAGFDGPYALVTENFRLFQNYALQAFNSADGILTQLAEYSPAAFDFTLSYAPSDVADGFVDPTPVHLEPIVYEGPDGTLSTSLSPPDFPAVNPVDGTAPSAPGIAFDEVAPEFDGSNKPRAPTIGTVDIPSDVPTYLSPAPPPLVSIVVPEFEGFTPITLPGLPPEFPFDDIPHLDFTYNEDEFSSPITEPLEQWLVDVLGGTTPTGLPPIIEEAIFGRAAEREERNYRSGHEEILTESANRGFTMPTGITNARLNRINVERLRQKNSLSREVMIQQHTVEIENLRYYTAQSIAYNGQLIGLFNAVWDRALRTAELTFNFALQSYRLQIEIYNSEVAAYEAEVRNYEAQVRARQAEVDVYRAEIEAERAKVDMNVALINAYEAEVRAATLEIQAYVAQVEGARAAIAAEQAKADVFATLMQGYRADIDAFNAETNAYGTRAGVNRDKAAVYASEAGAFAALIGAEVQVEGVKADIGRQIVADTQGRLAAIQAEATAISSVVDAERARLDALSERNRASSALYAAEGQVAEGRARAITARESLRVENERSAAAISLQNARLTLDSIEENNRNIVAAKDAGGRVAANLAGSAMAAINVGAGVSGTSSDSTSYEYSGTI